jgi:hypothetical protein
LNNGQSPIITLKRCITLVHIHLDLANTINAKLVSADHYELALKPMTQDQELVDHEIVQLHGYTSRRSLVDVCIAHGTNVTPPQT